MKQVHTFVNRRIQFVIDIYGFFFDSIIVHIGMGLSVAVFRDWQAKLGKDLLHVLPDPLAVLL